MPSEESGMPSAAEEDSSSRLECKQCGTSKTPMWRSGPLGPKTLCNACGVRAQRAHQRTRTGSAGSPSKDKPGLPLAPSKSDALPGSSSALYRLPERNPGRQPKPSPQPARQLSQRISSRQTSKVISDDEEISSDDDDLEAELLASSRGNRAAKRKHGDSLDSTQDPLRHSARSPWLNHFPAVPDHSSRDEMTHGAHPSPGSQASGQSSLDQGRRAACNGPSAPLGPTHLDPHPHAQLGQLRNGHPPSGLGPTSNGSGATNRLAVLPVHLVTRNKVGLQRFPNIQLHIRITALGGGPPGAPQRASGRHQLLVLSCLVRDGREAAVCAIPQQGLSVTVPMVLANPNGNGFRWESPQGWLVILHDRYSAAQLNGILRKWLGVPMDAPPHSFPQANGMHQGVTSSDLLQQRPFGWPDCTSLSPIAVHIMHALSSAFFRRGSSGIMRCARRQCEWDCKADQAASKWWTDLFRNNPERFSGQELPVDILERLLDTLELSSASLRLQQGIPEPAARAVLGNCSWAPAGAVCKAVFTYWAERRKAQPLQGLSTESMWQRAWPPLHQSGHPLSPLAHLLSPLLGLIARQPAESVLSNRLSPEGSQAVASSRPASDRGPAGSQSELNMRIKSLQLPQAGSRAMGPAFIKAPSAPCGFLSLFVPQDRPQSATSMDADFADALCGDDSGMKGAPGVGLGAASSPGSPVLIQTPLAPEGPQQQRVVSQESASASPNTSGSRQHSVSTLSTALSAPLFTEPLPANPMLAPHDELDMLSNFELAGSELLADVEAASLDLFSLPPSK